MEVNFITMLFGGVASVSLLIGIFILIRFNWFLGWLYGSIGLGLLTIAIIASVIILSFNNNLTIEKNEPIATIHFEKVGPKHYQAELAETHGEKYSFEMHGDLWEVSAEIVKWSGFLHDQGLQPYYRLEAVKASYAMLNDTKRLPKSEYAVAADVAGIDIFSVAESKAVPFMESESGRSGAIPMSDGALFSIRLTESGLVTKPENKVAFAVVK